MDFQTTALSDNSHFTVHTQGDNKTIFKCNMCSETYTNLNQIRDHFIYEFDLDKDSVHFLDCHIGIDQEDLDAPNLSPVSDDNSVTEPIECYKCFKTCKGTKGLNQHLGKRHSEDTNKEICELCGKTFKHKYAVSFHINQVHSKATRVKCAFCGKQVYNKYVLSQHLKKDHSN